MDWLRYSNQGATRNQPLAPNLVNALSFLPELGLTMNVISGGQDAEGPNRTGSTRHDHGNAVDADFYMGGRRLNPANEQDRGLLSQIVSRGRANGLTGFGEGADYMGAGRMHLGYGDESVWGAGGRSANASDWMRDAYYGTSQGQQPTMSTRGAPEMAQEPQGILGALGLQRRDTNATGQTAQPFTQRDNFKDLMGNLAMGFNSMRLNPDGNVGQQVAGARQGRRDEKRTNRSIEWLRSQPNGEQFAAMAEALGVVPALQAYQASNAPADQTSGMQNYDFLLAQGMDPAAAMERAFGAGGTSVNITNGAGGEIDPDAALRAGLSEGLIKEFGNFRTTGSAASAAMGDLNTLQELAALAPEGPVSGRLAQMFPEFNDVAALRDAIVKRVGPTLRAEGSGSTSDIEYQGMLDSLGNMRNTRAANSAIIAVMQAKAQFNIARSDIVNRMMGDASYTQAQAMQDLSALDQSSSIPNQVQRLIAAHGSNSGGAALSNMTPEELQAIVDGGQ